MSALPMLRHSARWFGFLLFTAGVTATASAQDGYADGSFGNDGLVVFDLDSLGTTVSSIPDMNRQSAGRVLVSVCLGSGPDLGVVLGVDRAGDLDPTFADGGILRLGSGQCANAIGVLPDDRFVMVIGRVGGSRLANNATYAADGSVQARLPDGRPDETWGTGGVSTLPPSFQPQRLATTAAGEIIVSGLSSEPSPGVAVTRLRLDGQIDAEFGEEGFGFIPVYAHSADLALSADGRIAIVDEVECCGGGLDPASEAVVTMFRPDGRPDSTFGGSGFVRLSRAANTRLTRIAFHPNGGTILAGSLSNDAALDDAPATVRLADDGSFDASYGNDGVVPGPGGSSSDLAFSDTGDLYVSRPFSGLQLSRINTEGGADPSFGSDGQVTVATPFSVDETVLLLQPNRTAVVAGWVSVVDRPAQVALARFVFGAPVSNGGGVPDAFALSVFPNPAVGQVTLSLDLPAPASVGIDVFDVLGRAVLHADKDLAVGGQRVPLDLRSLGAGRYIVRVQAPGKVRTAPLTVFR